MVLGLLVSRALDCGLLKGCIVGPEAPITLVQFPNDSLFILQVEMDQVHNLRCVLLMFEAMSGFKVNLWKSKMIAVGKVPHIHQLVDCFGCSIETLPCSYLGLPLGAKYKAISIWNLNIEKVDLRFAWCKAKHISKAGKLMCVVKYFFIFNVFVCGA